MAFGSEYRFRLFPPLEPVPSRNGWQLASDEHVHCWLNWNTVFAKGTRSFILCNEHPGVHVIVRPVSRP